MLNELQYLTDLNNALFTFFLDWIEPKFDLWL